MQACLYYAPDHLVPIFVLYIEVIDKTWCEYEPNQATNYALNSGLIMSKTPVNNSCIKIVAYTHQHQTTGCVDNGC